MLSLLHIENIAVIESCDLEFESGFHVLTGETGAGKSIVIDAIGAILGERTSRDLVRAGAQKARVSALFHMESDDARSWILENGYENSEEPDTLFIQREIMIDGKNICRVNGQPITVSLLRELGALLINIHGQHDSQQLLASEYHAMFLDRFTGAEELLSQYRESYERFNRLTTEQSALVIDEAEKERKLELLHYQIQELLDANLILGEEESLAERRAMLRDATRMLDALSQITGLFFGTDDIPGVVGSLSNIEHLLSRLAVTSPKLAEWAGRASELYEHTENLSEELRDFLESYDTSPEEIARVESRYDLISKLKRKYGSSIEEMLVFLKNAKEELHNIEFSEEYAIRLREEIAQAEQIARRQAEKLYSLRQNAGHELERRVSCELSELDMGKVRFFVSLSPRETLNARGLDDVLFLIATNPGEPPKPLGKIASGGELARIMLALKNVFAENDSVMTMIFDEVDTGVSGRAAQKVAEKISRLSRTRQVLCVTHLPQISAMADTHYRIEKSERDGRTYTTVTPLSFDGRVDELARLTGGTQITETTRSNARELLQDAERSKKELHP